MLGLVVQLQKKKGGAKGKSKPPTRSTRVHTFFDFFSPPVVPESEGDLTEIEMDALQGALEKDYELGCATDTYSSTHSQMHACCLRQFGSVQLVCVKPYEPKVCLLALRISKASMFLGLTRMPCCLAVCLPLEVAVSQILHPRAEVVSKSKSC